MYGYNFRGLISTSQFIFSRSRGKQNSCFKGLHLNNSFGYSIYDLGLRKPFCGLTHHKRILPAGIRGNESYILAISVYSHGEQEHMLLSGCT